MKSLFTRKLAISTVPLKAIAVLAILAVVSCKGKQVEQANVATAAATSSHDQSAPLMQAVKFGPVVSLADPSLFVSAHNAERAELAGLFDGLYFQKGDLEKEYDTVWDARSFFYETSMGGTLDDDRTRLPSISFGSQTLTEAILATHDVVFRDGSRVEALRKIALARQDTPPAMVGFLVTRVLVGARSGPAYPDLARQFLERQRIAMHSLSSIRVPGALAGGAAVATPQLLDRLLQQWLRQIAVEMLVKKVPGTDVDHVGWDKSPSNFYPLFDETLAAHYKRHLPGAFSGALSVLDLRRSFLYLQNYSWMLEDVTYDNQNRMLSGSIQSPSASFKLPFSVSIAPELKGGIDRQVELVYEVVPGKSLRIKKFVLYSLDESFYTEALVNLDMGVTLPQVSGQVARAPHIQVPAAPVPVSAAKESAAEVIDEPGLLTEDERQRLTEKVRRLNLDGKRMYYVIIVSSTAPETIAAYANRVAHLRKLGSPGRSNGVLIVVAPNNTAELSRLRIEVGNDASAALPNAEAARILSHIVGPKFGAEQYYSGLEAALDALDATP